MGKEDFFLGGGGVEVRGRGVCFEPLRENELTLENAPSPQKHINTNVKASSSFSS